MAEPDRQFLINSGWTEMPNGQWRSENAPFAAPMTAKTATTIERFLQQLETGDDEDS